MPAEAGILLDRRARPGTAQRVVIAIVACASGAAACLLAHAIDGDPQRGWWLALVVGAVFAGTVAWFAMLGTRITVGSDGVLTYRLHGRPNLSFELRQAAAFCPVGQGLLVGIGVELTDPQAVRFLHKAGISPERMRRWKRELGVDLVLEGFPPELAVELGALREVSPCRSEPPPAPRR